MLFPYLGGLRNISLAIGDFKANESLVNVLRSSRSIITLPTSELLLWSRNELISTVIEMELLRGVHCDLLVVCCCLLQ